MTTEPTEPPCAQEIAEAWDAVADNVQAYHRAPYDTLRRMKAEERLEEAFTAFARLLDRVKEHGT